MRLRLKFSLKNAVQSEVVVHGGFDDIRTRDLHFLEESAQLSSLLIMMSVIGGAIAPPFMGHIADVRSMRIGMMVPLISFVFITNFGAMWQMPEDRDAAK